METSMDTTDGVDTMGTDTHEQTLSTLAAELYNVIVNRDVNGIRNVYQTSYKQLSQRDHYVEVKIKNNLNPQAAANGEPLKCEHSWWFERLRASEPRMRKMIENGYCSCCKDIPRDHLDDLITTMGVHPLHIAVLVDDPLPIVDCVLECLHSVLDKQQSHDIINIQTRFYKRSIIHTLLEAKDNIVDIVRDIVQRGLNVLQIDRQSWTFLRHSVECKQYAVLEYLLNETVAGTLINTQDSFGQTPLIAALKIYDERSVKILLDYQVGEYHADVKLCQDWSPLCLALQSGKKDIVNMILNRDVDVNEKTTRSPPPLVLAIRMGDEDIVLSLLSKGANPNALDDDGNPAMLAASLSMVKLLLRFSVQVNLTNADGYSTLHYAAWDDTSSDSVEVVQLLLDSGAHHDVKTSCGNTALSLACHMNQTKVIDLLLPLGCNVNNRDKDDDMPLHYATYNKSLSVVRDLCLHGAETDAMNKFNVTPLWNAAYQGEAAIVKYLLTFNPNPRVKSIGIVQHALVNGSTCFQTPKSVLWIAARAYDAGKEDAVTPLLQAGVKLADEEWIFSLPFVFPKIQKELLQKVSEPMSLLQWSRIQVRENLRPCGQLQKQVPELEIPATLKDYLLMED